MKKQSTSFASIALRIIALALSLWLCVMLMLTWAAAVDFQRKIQTGTKTFKDPSPLEHEYSDTFPGCIEYWLIYYMDAPKWNLRYKPLPYMSDDNSLSHTLELPYGYDYSLIYFNEADEVMMTSGNRVTFDYTNAADWQNPSKDNHLSRGSAWIDLDAIPGAVQTFRSYDNRLAYSELYTIFRLTGWFEGDQFHPITLDNAEYHCVDCPGPWYSEIHCYEHWNMHLEEYQEFDAQNKLHWHNLLTLPADENREIVTIYGWSVDGILNDPQASVTVNGKTYDTLNDLRLESGLTNGTVGNIWETVIFRTVTRECDRSDEFYTFALTVRCRPMQYAIVRLIPLYQKSFAAIALAVCLLLWWIRRNLIVPLKNLNSAIIHNIPIKYPARWAEPKALEEHFDKIRNATAEAHAETIRLNNALDYARDAENRRKNMISSMGRELKAPLSVIHGYAKGLQADTDPQKQEQYIQDILDETHRMDAMVMEMLELSRLEAGKVKLYMGYFSLSAVIRSVAETFQPRMEEKALELRLDLEGDVQMHGHSIQIERVIRQYMDNALKYTPRGGQVYVRALPGNHGVFFYIANTCPHLPEDTLNRLYDPFCRADPTHHEKGAGLGLAIVKEILSLHNVQHYARNTTLDGQEAVEFGFRPM